MKAQEVLKMNVNFLGKAEKYFSIIFTREKNKKKYEKIKKKRFEKKKLEKLK